MTAVGSQTVAIRAFGDIDFLRRPDGSTSFALGQLDLFATAHLDDHVQVLAEVVAEAGGDNTFGVDVERLLVQFIVNDYFRVAAGRYHTSIGYYNTAYHHGLWFQVAASRPALFAFEDQGGTLPVHQVGVTMDGRIASGDANLHWVAEIGNGRGAAGAESVQNVVDADRHKSVNVALSSRPEFLDGSQFGISYYRDRFNTTPTTPVDESIIAVHAVLIRPAYQWLTEVVHIDHQAANGPSASSLGWYSQGAMRVGRLTPFVRYQFADYAADDPIYLDTGRRYGPSLGLRWDVSPLAALKCQYDHVSHSGEISHAATAQVAFVF